MGVGYAGAMRCWIAVGLAIASSGCNTVFGLEPTVALDAAASSDASPDRDDDGVLNEVDICPEVSDPAQHDEDGDGTGDACDPCALDPSTTGDGDGDGIDDACDPRPAAADCLVLFDSFVGFASTDWEQVAGSMVIPQPDAVRLVTPAPRTGLRPATISGPHSLRARFVAPSFAGGDHLRLLGSSMVSNSDIGHGCWIDAAMLSLVNVVPNPVPTAPFSEILGPSDTLVVSMIHDAPTTFACAVARATEDLRLSRAIQQSPGGNQPLIVVVGGEITMTALAVYAAQVGTCPAPVIR